MLEYLLCAAVWFDDGITYVHQPKNIATGFVVCGRRHHNCFATLSAAKFERKNIEKEQGFLTNTDRFVDRKEAAEIAFKARQISAQKTTLYSEDLW